MAHTNETALRYALPSQRRRPCRLPPDGQNLPNPKENQQWRTRKDSNNFPVTTAYRRHQIHVIDVVFGSNSDSNAVGPAETVITKDTYNIYVASDHLCGK
jgi:hypothetical protein